VLGRRGCALNMANQLKVEVIQNIRALKEQGWSQRRIARELGLDRETVRRHWKRGGDPKPATLSTPGNEGGEGPSPVPPGRVEPAAVDGTTGMGRPGLCDGFAALITGKLEQGLSAQRIHQDLQREVAFAGSYQSVKRFVRGLKEERPQRVWRIEVQPAEEAQVDFGLGAPVVEGAGGRRRRTWVFRIVLSFSRKAYSESVYRQDTETFLRCIENAFRCFGGVPKTLNLDNLKAAVLRFDWADPELNPKLAEFARHYRTVILPCIPRTPEHKGKVENSVGYVKKNALKARSFESLAAQNRFLGEWERNVADVRIHGTTRRQVQALFLEEAGHLLGLPPTLFPCFREGRRTVHRDSFVEVEKAYYAVPEEYIGHVVWARWDGREVRISTEKGEQIRMHCRLEPGRFSESLGVGGGRGSLQSNLDYWMGRAGELGEPVSRWAQGLVEHRGPASIRSLMGLVGLHEQHSFKALNTACATAVSRGAWRLSDVRQLLERPSGVQTQLDFMEDHPLIRNLAEYGLFLRNHRQT
jgi:transposase